MSKKAGFHQAIVPAIETGTVSTSGERFFVAAGPPKRKYKHCGANLTWRTIGTLARDGERHYQESLPKPYTLANDMTARNSSLLQSVALAMLAAFYFVPLLLASARYTNLSIHMHARIRVS